MRDRKNKEPTIITYAMPILLHTKNCAKVLLISEKDEELANLPMIESDAGITNSDAIKKFFKSAVPMDVDIDDVFNVYDYMIDGTRHLVTAFVGVPIYKGDLPVDDGVKEINFENVEFNNEILDMAMFIDIADVVKAYKSDKKDEFPIDDISYEVINEVYVIF